MINCEINLNLACVVADFTSDGKFKITNTKLYVPVVTLSTQGNAKLLERLKSIFKRTVNCSQLDKILDKNINGNTKPIFRLLNWSSVSVSK